MRLVNEKRYSMFNNPNGLEINNPGSGLPGLFIGIKIQSLPDFRRKNDTP